MFLSTRIKLFQTIMESKLSCGKNPTYENFTQTNAPTTVCPKEVVQMDSKKPK